MRDEIRATFSQLCGRELTAVQLEQHVFNHRVTSLVSIWLEFGEQQFQLRGTSHGEGLAIQQERPAAFDMEQYGHHIVGEPNDPSIWSLGEIETVWIVRLADSNDPAIGVRWRVRGVAVPMTVYCIGDELYAEPEPKSAPERLAYEQICGPA